MCPSRTGCALPPLAPPCGSSPLVVSRRCRPLAHQPEPAAALYAESRSGGSVDAQVVGGRGVRCEGVLLLLVQPADVAKRLKSQPCARPGEQPSISRDAPLLYQ